MYNERIVDRCVRHLKENNRATRGFLRLTAHHKDVVNAAVEYLEKVHDDADYERNKALKDSFKFLSTDSNADDDSEEDEYDDFRRAMRGEPPLDNPSSALNVGEPKEHADCEEDNLDEDFEETLELFSKLSVATELDQGTSSNIDVSNWLSRLQRSQSVDKFYKICNEADLERLKRLRGTFPNLATVVEQVIGAATLSAKAKAPFKLPALLIDGSPGIGKTYLIQELSELLDIPLVKINMANLSGRFELVGGHRTYRDAEPSLLFKELYECPIANPFVLFDEAECGDPRLYQPLYHMVEGRCFRDHFLNIDFRVDGANYLFITNDKDLIAPALRSRLTEFDVVAPTLAQMQQILQRLYDDVCESSALFESFIGNLAAECLLELSRSSLRVAKNRIKSALLSSAAHGSTDRMLLDELKKSRTQSDKHSMGFLK